MSDYSHPQAFIKVSRLGYNGPEPITAKQDQDAGAQLSYIDFVPGCLRAAGYTGQSVFQSFGELVEKANRWLQNHPASQVKNVESVEVRLPDSGAVVDTGKLTYYHYGKGRTTYIKTIRLWVEPKSSVPSKLGFMAQQLGYETLMPEAIDDYGEDHERSYETLGRTVARYNERIRNDPGARKVLSIQTEQLRFTTWNDPFDPECCHRVESNDGMSHSRLFIRVFHLKGIYASEEIDFADFDPACINVKSKNPQFESFTKLVQKAGRWSLRQQNIRITNIESPYIKLPEKWAHYEDLNTENTVYAGHVHNTTTFLRLLRMWFVKSPMLHRNSIVAAGPPGIHLNCKTFFPVMLNHGGTYAAPGYESMQVTLRRALAWLTVTGSKVVGCETVPMLMRRGTEIGKSETTCSRGKGSRGEYWLTILRIYIDGEYTEPASNLLPPEPQIDTKGGGCVIV